MEESYKIDYISPDKPKDEDQEKEDEEEKENAFITQIQSLERTVEEFVKLDNDTLGSLSNNEKKQIKTRLSSMVEKLNEVIEKI